MTVAALMAFFPSSKKPNLKSGPILVIIKMLRDSWSRMAALSAGAVREKFFLRGSNTSSLLTHLHDHHHQLLSGKLT